MNQGDNQWKSIYILGAVTALIALVGILKFTIQLFKLGSEKSPGFGKRITKDENTFYR